MESANAMFTPLRQESVVDHVFNSVISAIIRGELHPSDQLPTEAELCRSLGASRNSVREAIKKLEACGLVTIRRAEGTFVCDSYNEKMLDPLLYGILLSKNSWDDFVKLRGVLDIGVMYQVCHTIRLQDVSDLNYIVDEMAVACAENPPSIDRIMDIDRAFHSRVVKCMDSPMTLSVMEYVTAITIPSRHQTVERILQQNAGPQLVQKHRDIVDVLKQHRFADIESVVQTHYEFWKVRD